MDDRTFAPGASAGTAPQLPVDDDAGGDPGAEVEIGHRSGSGTVQGVRAERGRRKEAAERLGISPRTLRYKLAQMRDAGMDVEGYLFAS